MVKFVALLTRKPGMSRADFINYYESRHATVIMGLMPPTYSAYRRNYVEEGSRVPAADPLAPRCDVITEVEFPDRRAFEDFMKAAAVPAIAEAIAKDEENFLDRSKHQCFTVEVRSSPPR
jgi:hypothetical protein